MSDDFTEGRGFAPYMYTTTWRQADQMRRDGQTAVPPTAGRTFCFASPIAKLLAGCRTDAATNRLGRSHVVVQHKVCRKTKRRTPSSKRNTTQQNCCYMFRTKTLAIQCSYWQTFLCAHNRWFADNIIFYCLAVYHYLIFFQLILKYLYNKISNHHW